MMITRLPANCGHSDLSSSAQQEPLDLVRQHHLAYRVGTSRRARGGPQAPTRPAALGFRLRLPPDRAAHHRSPHATDLVLLAEPGGGLGRGQPLGQVGAQRLIPPVRRGFPARLDRSSPGKPQPGRRYRGAGTVAHPFIEEFPHEAQAYTVLAEARRPAAWVTWASGPGPQGRGPEGGGSGRCCPGSDLPGVAAGRSSPGRRRPRSAGWERAARARSSR